MDQGFQQREQIDSHSLRESKYTNKWFQARQVQIQER